MPQFDKAPYQTTSAVLFVIFNRPDTTQKVFDRIKAAKPSRLYIAADAPRPGFPEDELLCRQARSIVGTVDWYCDVKTLFQEENVGCRDGVSSAVTWFFTYE